MSEVTIGPSSGPKQSTFQQYYLQGKQVGDRFLEGWSDVLLWLLQLGEFNAEFGKRLVDLSVSRGLVDFLVDHGQHVCNSGYFNAHSDIRFHHLVHLPKILELSFDAPQLTKPADVVLLELLLQDEYFLKSLLDLSVIGIPWDGVGKKQIVEKTMRFDEPIEIHELACLAFAVAIWVDLDNTCCTYSCSLLMYLQN